MIKSLCYFNISKHLNLIWLLFSGNEGEILQLPLSVIMCALSGFSEGVLSFIGNVQFLRILGINISKSVHIFLYE